ncbi:MAG: VWA domain-containing protein [Pirellulaceae bacterium]|nr:VWA domain-containing protein [Pirellulaceae bacterium]
MKLTEGLRSWWQRQTGEDETPFDGDSTGFIASLIFHLCLLLALGLVPLVLTSDQVSLTITAPVEEPLEEVLELAKDVYFAEQPSVEVGANSFQGLEVALSLAPEVSEVSEVPNLMEVTTTDVAQIEINETIRQATGLHYSENLAVKGAVGQGETGASGAVDRITHEILLSLEERKTLVVWLFDQSGSLTRQREAIHDRFAKIYEELGVLEAAGSEAFAKHDNKPLLTSVVAFGNNVSLLTEKPTDNLAEIQAAVAAIPQDDSGVEKVFSAIYMAADRFKSYRVGGDASQPERNVMLVVFTDEVGDDTQGLEHTIGICRRYAMPVYVVGVPAPFGQADTMVKWVDPNPEFDQSPQWGQVKQGPESFLPERLKLSFSGGPEDRDPIDSGFGPFALTRLCIETGGIYFAVHPNRNVNRAVNRQETAAYSAHLKHFFDPQVMRKYRPDYVSADEYQRRAGANKARAALLTAAQMSHVSPMDSPQLRFVKRDEAQLSNDLSEAQKAAAKLEPKVLALYETLKLGETDRETESSLRWQAGYDLAMGRVLAVRVRTEAYNAMLAKAKRGMKFEDDKNNTWVLKPDDEISVGSQMAKMAERASMYLNRVVEQHPGTPWAMLAERELQEPLGWKWAEEFTDLSPQGNGNAGNNNPAPARNDARNMMQKPPAKRPVPKL